MSNSSPFKVFLSVNRNFTKGYFSDNLVSNHISNLDRLDRPKFLLRLPNVAEQLFEQNECFILATSYCFFITVFPHWQHFIFIFLHVLFPLHANEQNLNKFPRVDDSAVCTSCFDV